MSSANFVATLGKDSRIFLGRARCAVYQETVVEAEKWAENFVLVGAPPEPEAYSADDCLFGA